MAGQPHILRRHLLSLQALSELGPQLTAERPFDETAAALLSTMMESVGACEGALFSFSDKPAMLAAVASAGYANFPRQAVIPLLPRHVHALAAARLPQILSPRTAGDYLSANGNLSPETFRCIAPLQVSTRLVGMVGFGRRQGDPPYAAEDMDVLSMFTPYVALAVSNHALAQTLEQKIAENLHLLASTHAFHDHTLEAFAAAIDIKDSHTRGHSLRVGRYASGIAEACGMPQQEVAAMRAAGYLHDIGKVAVDKYIFAKPGALDNKEFQEMADHTVVGHQIVQGVEFPWEHIPETVRSHHERMDGSGYPDHLQGNELTVPMKIMAVADCFDAMTSPRSYRKQMSVGEAASTIVRATPEKFDADVVQALLIQLRRDAVRVGTPVLWGGKFGDQPAEHRAPFLDDGLVPSVSPADIDNIASLLTHKVSSNRTYFA